jgi:hypothetical protein
MKDGEFLLGLFVAFLAWVALSVNWSVATNTVATECDKMGQFYVGKNVYECKRKVQQ